MEGVSSRRRRRVVEEIVVVVVVVVVVEEEEEEEDGVKRMCQKSAQQTICPASIIVDYNVKKTGVR